MPYDVVVVGGGIGGLTVAALTAARGLRVCLLERQSQVGGCVGRVEHSGYEFDPGRGLYTGFGPGEIFERIFSELPLPAPNASRVESDYVVRLAPETDIQLYKTDPEFFDELRRVFPECATPAIEFYTLVKQVAESTKQPRRSGVFAKVFANFQSKRSDVDLERARSNTTISFAQNTSPHFQRFIDAQLKTFLQTGIERCSFAAACVALMRLRATMYSFDQGVAELAERLSEAIKKSGGVVRLNSPVLRLAYDASGKAIGVDLLSGERVEATRAIVSNLTIWDTYGRLVGLQRTPTEIKRELQQRQSNGVFVTYAAVDEAVVDKLPAQKFLVSEHEEDENGFTFSLDSKNSDGKFPATIITSTEVAPWFAFQTSEEDYEERDQEALEHFWERLHRAIPELGSGIEVIETANPRTYYEQTRRKLGMVIGFENTPEASATEITQETSVPNLLVVGDTTGIQPNLEVIARSAQSLANRLTK
ncbi:MAG TPA: FAD-dependent oxidoreductase [Pyrinomonadaceae bacterium]